MCSVKNFRVGQFLRNTWGLKITLFSTRSPPRSKRFKFLSIAKTQRSSHVFRQKLSRRAVFGAYMGAQNHILSL